MAGETNPNSSRALTAIRTIHLRAAVCSLLVSVILFWSLIRTVGAGKSLSDCLELRSPDTLTYIGLIQLASENASNGDSLIHEHRNSPSIVSMAGYWLKLLGGIAALFGISKCMLLLIPFFALWLFALWKILTLAGVPSGPAFFLGYLVPGVIINTAELVVGGGKELLFQNLNLALWGGDFWRLYPTTISMAVYALAVLALLQAERKGIRWHITAGLLFGLTIYGRPFDWMVLLILHGMLICGAFISGNTHGLKARCTGLMAGGLMASPYLFAYLSMSFQHGNQIADVFGRHVLQAKEWSHYIKYSCLFMAAAIPSWMVMRALQRDRDKDIKVRTQEILWLLFLASFLGHYYTILGRKTILGVFYFAVFSIAPWGFMWLCAATGGRWLHGAVFKKEIVWFLFTMSIATASAFLLHRDCARPLAEEADWQDRKACYSFIRAKTFTPQDLVVFSLRHTHEIPMEIGCRIYVPGSLSQSCSAPTKELLERYLILTHLFRGNFNPLSWIIEADGLSLAQFKAKLDPSDREWQSLLVACIGDKNLNFHPAKSHADMAVRNISLPPHLRALSEEVVYLPPALAEVYQRVQTAAHGGNEARSKLLRKYRLDYCILRKDRIQALDPRSEFVVIHESGNFRVLGRKP